jgi:hypothetical protein
MKSEFGCAGSWSEPLSFTVASLPAPGMPALIAPADGSVADRQPTYRWSRVAQADSYTVQFGWPRDGAILWVTQDLSDTAACSGSECSVVAPAPFECGQESHWTVEAVNASGRSGFPPPATFTASGTRPAMPAIIGPNGTIETRFPLLQWYHQTEVQQYAFSLCRMDDAGSCSEAISGTLDPSTECGAGVCSVDFAVPPHKLMTGLANGLYRWTVVGINDCGWSEGAVGQFSIDLRCGDGRCDSGETPETCPEDCCVVPGSC